MNILIARESAIASATPLTSSGGRRLVKSEPGPTVITSAFSIAAKGFRHRIAVFGFEIQSLDIVADFADVRFAADDRPVEQFGRKTHVGYSCRVDMTFARKNLRRKLNRLGKIAGDLGKRREKKISEAVSAEVAVAAEPMSEQLRQKMRVFGKGDHAVADIARRQHLQFVAKPARASAVVRNRDDGRKVFDPNRLPSSGSRRIFSAPTSSVERPLPPPIATKFKPFGSVGK